MIPDRKLEQYVPYILRDVEEFKAIMQAGQKAFDNASKDDDKRGTWQALEKALRDAFLTVDKDGFVETTEYGLSRWEQMLNIVPPPQSGDSKNEWLKKRLGVILARIQGNAPYTYLSLVHRLLSALFDGDESKYRVELSVYDVDGWVDDLYSIKVSLEMGNEAVLSAVDAMLKRVIPCNLLFVLTMMYNRHIDYKPYTHEQMSRYTQEELKSRKWQDGDWS